MTLYNAEFTAANKDTKGNNAYNSSPLVTEVDAICFLLEKGHMILEGDESGKDRLRLIRPNREANVGDVSVYACPDRNATPEFSN